MSQAAIQEMARRVARLEQLVQRMSTPQLAHSTIEGGATRIRGDEGELTGMVGRQYDGTFGAVTLWGPLPPTPAQPTVTPIAGGLRVRVDGTYDPPTVQPDPDLAPTPVVAPQDFRQFEVHASTDPAFSGLLWTTLRRTIDSSRGGEVEFGVPTGVDYYVRIITRTTSGRSSLASTVVGPFQAGKVGEGDIDLDFGMFGGTTVFYGSGAPSTGLADHYGDLYLREMSVGPPPVYQTYRWYPDDTWKLLEDQGASDALAAAVLAQSAADSKAKVFYADTEPAWTGAAGTALWFDTNDGNRAYSWDGTDFVDRRIGNGAIQPASLIASDLIATGTVSASLLESILVLATVIVAGNSAGAHVEISSLGVDFYDLGPDGELVRTGGWGTGDDGFGLTVAGATTVSFTPDGVGSVLGLNVSGFDLNADGIIDGGMVVYGREYLDWMDDKAGGSSGSAFFGDSVGGVFASGISSRYGLGEHSFIAKPGRHYWTVFDGMHFSADTAGLRGLLSVRFTTDGSAPTISNGTIATSKFFYLPSASTAYSAPALMVYGSYGVSEVQVRYLLTVERVSSTGLITTHTYTAADAYRAPFRFFTNEMGRDIPDTYIANDGGGVRSGGTATGTPAIKRTYTSTWDASFIGSYYGSDGRRTDTSDMYQGQTPYYPANGNQKALAGFTGNAIVGETTKTITAALSGATISKVEMYLYCNHSHYNSGGTCVIGFHGNTTLPATAPGASFGAFGPAHFDKGAGRWITLPSSTHASWASGTYRGITVGPGTSTDPVYYMRFTGTGGQRPLIRITYTR